MNRFATALFTVGVFTLLTLAGCGGGGGNNSTVSKTTRTITGKIITAGTDKGIGNVLVTLGNTDTTTTTNSSGVFSFKVNKTASLPTYFQVDVSGAGPNYSPANVITFNSQNYLPKKIDMPINVLNGITGEIGTLSAYDITGVGTPPPPPYDAKYTLIMGRIVDGATSKAVSGATIKFGSSTVFTTTSGANGYFAVNIGYDKTAKAFYPDTSGIFEVDTSTAKDTYPTTMGISLRDITYEQNAIDVPTDIIEGTSTDLGTLSVVKGGGITPPPPPPDTGGDTDDDNPPIPPTPAG